MQMGKIGAWVATNALDKHQLADLARGLDNLGYDALWYPESTSYDSLSLGAFLLSKSERLAVASGIANIYARDAYTAVAGHNSLNMLYGDRFVLGLEAGSEVANVAPYLCYQAVLGFNRVLGPISHPLFELGEFLLIRK